MKQLGVFLSAALWLLVAGSVAILTGGLFGRPVLMAAVPTGSMIPILQPGDLIVVLPTWVVPAVKERDIVVFKTPQNRDWIVHRIIEGNAAEGFVTKGDNNPVSDPDRVFPREIAGVVPQWQDGALHLPRLGLLSIDQGPLSSPVVAGVALAMGLYLLVMDVKPRVKLPKFRLQRRSTASGTAVLSLYLGLSGAVFLSTLIPAWTLSQRQLVQYEVIAQRHLNWINDTEYLLGERHMESVPVSNPSPLPLIIIFQSSDPYMRYAPEWVMLAPHGKQSLALTIANPDLGKHESYVTMGVFLPLLPPTWLLALSHISVGLAVIVAAAVPALLMLLIALVDDQNRAALSRIRTRLSLRFMH